MHRSNQLIRSLGRADIVANDLSGVPRRRLRCELSKCRNVGLAGANAHGLVDVEHKYLPVPDLPSLRGRSDGLDGVVDPRSSLVQNFNADMPSPRSEQLGAPNPPAIRFTRGTYFGASRFTHLLRPTKLLALLYGSDRYARPSRAFTSRLPTDRLPSPLLDMTTTATGLLCWRDFHPLEWQLASLHQIRTCGFPAYGSHLGSERQSSCRMRSGACGTRAWRW